MIATNAPTAKAEQSIEERFDHLSQNRQLLIDLQAKNIPPQRSSGERSRLST
jgi:hypothetical protein